MPATLPFEMWGRIFRDLSQDGCHGDLFTCLTIRRDLTDLAEKALYHKLVLSSGKNLQRVCSRILARADDPIRDARYWVHSVQIKVLLVYLMSEHEKAQYQDNVTVLCISLPCLRDLELESFPARAAFMVGLALHSSLTCLNIIIKEGSLGVLPLINKLQTLKELTIKIDEDQSELFPLDQPIIRPLMVKLSLIVIDDIDAVTLMNYLALCRVHPSCQVLLDLECTSNPIESGMLLFLKAHTFCKVELCLNEHQCSYLGNWGKLLDPLSHVVFTGSIPFSRIPCKLPKVVELQVNSGTYDNEHLTWDFLDQALKQCTQVPGQSSTIRILCEAGSQPMRWTITNPNDDGEAMFTGRLLRHARLLYDHGVYVVDQGWEDVRGMVRAPSQPCVCGLH